MPDNPDVSVNYKILLNHVREGMLKIIPNESDKAYPVNELLGLVQINSE
jgi:hypothetical protein